MEIYWENDFEIGHERIDFEHRIFFDLILNLLKAGKQIKDQKYITRLIYEIQKYAEFHFVSEENIMIDIDYPELAQHRKLHLDLLEDFNNNLMVVNSGGKDVENFVTFLINWFRVHTCQEDKKISSFIEKRIK